MNSQAHGRKPLPSPRSVQDRVIEKVKSVRISPKGMAIFDALLGIQPRRTDPAIVELVITVDDMLLARHEGDVGFNDVIGPASNLTENALGIARTAEMSEEEKAHFIGLIDGLRVHPTPSRCRPLGHP